MKSVDLTPIESLAPAGTDTPVEDEFMNPATKEKISLYMLRVGAAMMKHPGYTRAIERALRRPLFLFKKSGPSAWGSMPVSWCRRRRYVWMEVKAF